MTVNSFGKGKAYYMAARMQADFMTAFYGKLSEELGIEKALDTELPGGVTAQLRTDGKTRYVFLMNFNAEAVSVKLDGSYTDLLTDSGHDGEIVLARFGVAVLKG